MAIVFIDGQIPTAEQFNALAQLTGAAFTGNVTSPLPVTDVTATAGTTLTAAQMINGAILRSGPTAAFSDTTDTATNILAALPGAAIGTAFTLTIVNSTAYAETIVAGSGVTLAGSTVLPELSALSFVGQVTDVSTPAVTLTGLAALPSLTSAGNIAVPGNETVGGTLGVTGNATVGGTLGVTGAATLSDTLAVTDAATVGGTLGVTGAATLDDTLAVTGDATVGGTLGVTGAVTLSDTLAASGNVSGAAFAATAAAASLAGTTAGTIEYVMPEQGVAKKFVAYANAYENDTTTSQTITFPVAFANVPAIVSNTTGLTVSATATTLTITAPDATTTYTGVIVIEGI